MITTHTLGQVCKAGTLCQADSLAHTDLLTLHAASVHEQVAFNHRLFGLDQISDKHTCCSEWFDSGQYYEALTVKVGAPLTLNAHDLLTQIDQANTAGYRYKAAVLGPVSLVWTLNIKDAQRMKMLEHVLPLYTQLLSSLDKDALEWIQFDEPMLTRTLSREWQHAYRTSYFKLQRSPIKIMVASTFGALQRNIQLACQLPVQALHIDAYQSPEQILRVVDWLPRHKILSLGVLSGNDLAKSDLNGWLHKLKPFAARLKERLWLAPNLSLQHMPVESPTGDAESTQNPFVMQKIRELIMLSQGLTRGEFNQPVRLPRTNAPMEYQGQDKDRVA